MINLSHQKSNVTQLMLFFTLLFSFVAPLSAQQQNRQNPDGEWRYQSGDAWGTRYSPVDQINADNFGDLDFDNFRRFQTYCYKKW